MTGLASSPAEAVLFLACDMPFVTAGLLRRLLARLTPKQRAVFYREEAHGFPFVIRTSAVTEVRALIDSGQLALSNLADRLQAATVASTPSDGPAGLNVNTPADLAHARKLVG